MTYQESEKEDKIKTILSEFNPINFVISKYKESDRDDNNFLFMTVEDLRKKGYVDNVVNEVLYEPFE